MSDLIPAFITAGAAFCAVFASFALNRFLRPRPRVEFDIGPNAVFDIELPASRGGRAAARRMKTTRMLLVNRGAEPAMNLEIALTCRPDGISTIPVRNYALKESSGRFIVEIESLAAGERLDLEMLSIGDVAADISTVRCENCTATRNARHLKKWAA